MQGGGPGYRSTNTLTTKFWRGFSDDTQSPEKQISIGRANKDLHVYMHGCVLSSMLANLRRSRKRLHVFMHIHLQSQNAHTYNIRVHASCPVSASEPNTASSIGAEYVTTKLSDVDMIAFRGTDAASVLRQASCQHRRPDSAIRRRPDFLSKAKSCFNIFLNIL